MESFCEIESRPDPLAILDPLWFTLTDNYAIRCVGSAYFASVWPLRVV